MKLMCLTSQASVAPQLTTESSIDGDVALVGLLEAQDQERSSKIPNNGASSFMHHVVNRVDDGGKEISHVESYRR